MGASRNFRFREASFRFWGLRATVTLTRNPGSTGKGKWDAYTCDLSENVYAPYVFDLPNTPVAATHVQSLLQANGYEYWTPGNISQPAAAITQPS